MKKIFIGFIFVLCLFITACSANNKSEPVESEPQANTSQVSPNPPQETTSSASQDEKTEPKPEPIPVQNPQPAILHNKGATIAAGNYSSFAVQPDGSLWGWGLFGEIEWERGLGPTLPPPPRPIPEIIMYDVVSVSAGGWLGSDSPVMIIKTNGSLWALGNNTHGQLGDSTTTSRSEPIKIMDDKAAVSVGGFHTMAIKTDGSLWAWGGNGQGQLGDGTTTDRHTPVKIMDDVIAISAGAGHSMAITSDGVLWGWGHNGTGRLGYAATADELNPIHPSPMKIMDDVAEVSAGFDHTMVIKKDGSLWAFGSNAMGRLGVGPPTIPPETPWSGTPSPSPHPIKIMDGVVAIAAGDCHSLAITSDGSLWGWGYIASRMQTGNNTLDINTPMEILWEIGLERMRLDATPYVIMENVASVSTWGDHTLAVRTDGSIWAFGDNRHAQIGDGGEYGFPEEGGVSYHSSPALVHLPAS